MLGIFWIMVKTEGERLKDFNQSQLLMKSEQ